MKHLKAKRPADKLFIDFIRSAKKQDYPKKGTEYIPTYNKAEDGLPEDKYDMGVQTLNEYITR